MVKIDAFVGTAKELREAVNLARKTGQPLYTFCRKGLK